MRIKYEQPSVCHQSYKSVLGQRPIWDWRHDKLLWVDIYENKIIETDQDNNEERQYSVQDGVTNILLQDNKNYIMSSYDSLYSIHPSLSKKQLLTKINFDSPNNRINDADIDLNGQIWISTMDIQQKSQTGKVICHDSNLKPIYSDNSYIISNGPVFDYERNVGYVTDSIKSCLLYTSPSPRD